MANPVEGGACKTNGDCAFPRSCIDQRCRDVACLPGGVACSSRATCCSGTCNTSNLCQVDQPPLARPGPATQTVPIRIPVQLTNGSIDPDIGVTGQGLSYVWTIDAIATTTQPSTAAGFAGTLTGALTPTSTALRPFFRPDVPGTYTLGLVATNGPVSSAKVQITVVARNTAPAITMPANIPVEQYRSRNVDYTFTAVVSDADGDTLDCTWAKKAPSSGAFVHVSTAQGCAYAPSDRIATAGPSSAFTLHEDEAGTWEIALGVDDHVNPVVTVVRLISVQNDAPVLLPEPSTAKMPARYGNVRSAALVPLHGSYYDVNGDTVTWQWSMTGVKPQNSTAARFVPAAANQKDVDFEPDEEGLYTLELHVDDLHGGTADKAVDVVVGPYVLPLGRVVDAAFVAGKIVAIGEDGGSGKVWVVNPATSQIAATVSLTSVPTALGVSQDGTQAVIARAGGEWELLNVTTGTLVGSSRPALGFEASSIAWANGRVYATGLGGTVRRLLPGAVAAPYDVVPEQPASFDPISGVRAVGSATHLWLLGGTAGAGTISRYLVDTNDQVRDPVQNGATAVASASGMWLSATGAELFFGGKLDVHDANSSAIPHLSKLGTLGAQPTHVGTMDDGGTLRGVVSQDTTSYLTLFSGTVFPDPAPATEVIPFIAENGEKRDPRGRFAFVTKVSATTTYYAIVAFDRGTVTTTDDLWGLFTIVPAP
jgi:hypothetical protein